MPERSDSSDVVVRTGGPGDLERIAQIQALSPEAARWHPADYLVYDLLVAVAGGRVCGFAVARRVAPGEAELLNVAVDPACRRRGVARLLVADLTSRHRGEWYLEVRESNTAARALYKSLGFQEIMVRPRYYEEPSEGAVVMNFRSCYCHR